MLKQLMKYEGVMVKNVCCIALLTLMFVGSETQGQQGVSTFTNTLSNAAGTNGLVRDANQDWNEVFSAFPVPPDPNIEIDARLTLADLISHFNKSSITNVSIKDSRRTQCWRYFVPLFLRHSQLDLENRV
jgi:hypothetical protein